MGRRTRSDKGPLREHFVLHILLKASKVLDEAQSGVIAGDLVKHDQWVVLAHVVICASSLVRVIVPLETGVGQVLLVVCPGDTLGVEKVRQG